jgi:ubiquinone/menaquinone biosynthesis C-methylase UbiE
MRPPSDFERDVSQDRHRRLSFGSVAEQYDRHRPGYPDEMVDAVLEYAQASPGERILDVGAGTGRATLLFAERGYELTAIEPDGEMAAVASQRAATAGQSVEILNTDFEQASLPPAGFRVVISATAWHWVTSSLRNELAARVLAPGGALAPFWNRPQWEDNPLRPAFDRAYAAVEQEFAARPPGPMNPIGAPPQIRNAAEWLEEEFESDADFTDVDARVFSWPARYSSEQYIGLLGTHSDHITLPQAPRERLFEEVAAAIDEAGGSFELTYQTLLCLARRRAT